MVYSTFQPRLFHLIPALFFPFVFSAQASAEAIFVYIEESCNSGRGVFLTKAREGLFDALFDAGHIIFDDATDNGAGARLSKADLSVPLAQARRGGADLLLALSIESTAEKTSPDPKAPERIESRGVYSLYEVGTGRKCGEGTVALSNKGNENEMTRERFGRAFGLAVGNKAVDALSLARRERQKNEAGL